MTIVKQFPLKGGGGLGLSGSVTLRFQTDRVTAGKKTATIQCDNAFVQVDWGDGVVERLRGTTFAHEYATAGTYDVKVSTIGGSRFTPRYSTQTWEAPGTKEGRLELIGLFNGATWRASSNFSGAFSGTNLALVDPSCQQAFNRVTTAAGAFRNTPLQQFYSGFNMPLCTNARGMFDQGSLVEWPASATFEKCGDFTEMLRGNELATFPDIDFGAAVGTTTFNIRNVFNGNPFVQGGFPDNFRIPAGSMSLSGWGAGALWTTPPALQWPAVTSGQVGLEAIFYGCSSMTSVPKEALDFRNVTGSATVRWNFGGFVLCPNLTTIDFSWCPRLIADSISGWSPNIRNIILADPSPALVSWKWDCGNSRLSANSIEQILTRINANGASNNSVVFCPTGNIFAPPWSAAGLPTPGESRFQYTGAAGQSDPIETWSTAAVAAKDALVSRGYRVGYYANTP